MSNAFIQNVCAATQQSIQQTMSSEFEALAKYLATELDVPVERITEVCNAYQKEVVKTTKKGTTTCAFSGPKGGSCSVAGKEQVGDKWYCGPHAKKVEATPVPAPPKAKAAPPPKTKVAPPVEEEDDESEAAAPPPKAKAPPAKVVKAPVQEVESDNEDVEVPVDSDAESESAPPAKAPPPKAKTPTKAPPAKAPPAKAPAAKKVAAPTAAAVLNTVRAKTNIQATLNMTKVGAYHIEPIHRIAFNKENREVIGVLSEDAKKLLPLNPTHIKFVEAHGLTIADSAPRAKKVAVVVKEEPEEESEQAADGDEIESDAEEDE